MRLFAVNIIIIFKIQELNKHRYKISINYLATNNQTHAIKAKIKLWCIEKAGKSFFFFRFS